MKYRVLGLISSEFAVRHAGPRVNASPKDNFTAQLANESYEGSHSDIRLGYIEMRQLLGEFKNCLSSFASSSEKFRLIWPPNRFSRLTLRTLLVLDSSYNPPSRAHFRIADLAWEDDRGAPPKGLLLLLATQNADKDPKPASFEDRLVMMATFARELSAEVLPTPSIYIGLIKCPYFLDKATAISSSGEFPSNPEQVYLTGYDTLVRIMDPKYYPPTHNLAALDPFMKNHRLRVTFRPNDGWGSKNDQEAYLQRLAQGGMEAEGGMKEWVERIELVEGQTDGDVFISSTAAREAARTGDEEPLRRMVTDGVANWIVEQRLYRDQV